LFLFGIADFLLEKHLVNQNEFVLKHSGMVSSGDRVLAIYPGASEKDISLVDRILSPVLSLIISEICYV
jgi:hypothetical protein